MTRNPKFVEVFNAESVASQGPGARSAPWEGHHKALSCWADTWVTLSTRKIPALIWQIAEFTRIAIYLGHEEKDKGTLEPGKLADLIFIDRDYLTWPAADLATPAPTKYR